MTFKRFRRFKPILRPERRFTRRRSWLIAACTGLIFLTGSCVRRDKPVEWPLTGKPMKVARYYWPGQYWKDIAADKGWFAEAGLNVEMVDTNPDYFKSLADAAADRMDVNSYTLFDLVAFNAKGSDLTLVIICDHSMGMDAIVTRRGIGSIAELKGKKIGVNRGTYTEFLLAFLLEKSGLSIKDVQTVDMANEELTRVFIDGKLDAIVTWEPLVTEAVQKGGGVRIFDTSQTPGIAPGVEGFQRRFIRERPGDVMAYVKVWDRATRFIKEYPQEAYAIIGRIYKVPVEQVEALTRQDKILDLDDNHIGFSHAASFDSLYGTARKINDFMINQEMTKGFLNTAKLIDSRFIKILETEKKRMRTFSFYPLRGRAMANMENVFLME